MTRAARLRAALEAEAVAMEISWYNTQLPAWLAMEARGEGAVRFRDGVPEFVRGARVEYPRGAA